MIENSSPNVIQYNERGFAYTEFTDSYGVPCSLQESSNIKPSIWLGTQPKTYTHWLTPDKGKYEERMIPENMMVHTRMHLSQEQVKQLLPFLKHFAETGHLPSQS